MTMSFLGGSWCGDDWCETNWCVPYAKMSVGAQLEIVPRTVSALRCSFNVRLYNVQLLRILWEIASDGNEDTDFTASSEVNAYFGASNLRSDIVEQVWKSTGCTAEWFQFDCGNGVAVAIDTLALINHNLTSSAVIRVRGYGSGADAAPGSWASADVDFTVDMPADRPNEDRVIWCSPTVVTTPRRHWRVDIQDATNSDGFISVGRFVAGEALILSGENFNMEVEFGKKSFSDKLKLNGFTSVANARALKRGVKLHFTDLNVADNTNFNALDNMSDYIRDTLKALVIPDPANPYLLSAYARLVTMPRPTFRFITDTELYASFDLEFDEAE